MTVRTFKDMKGGRGKGETKQYSNSLPRHTMSNQGVANTGTSILDDLVGNDLI